MSRCVLAAGTAFALAAFQFPALAQLPPRAFPQNSLRGEMVFGDPPAALLNRQPVQLSPGSRIRGADNFAVMATAIEGIKLHVNYTIDLGGNTIKDVWILTPAEDALLWPHTPTEAQNWVYNPMLHTWSKP